MSNVCHVIPVWTCSPLRPFSGSYRAEIFSAEAALLALDDAGLTISDISEHFGAAIFIRPAR